ncbi:transposase [Ruminococcus sp. 210702-SL.1.03]|uniref:transposase n=1 Tax=Ruminococcus sp. 210702-SL.1.03 TaxID=2883233 RepID=UPI001D08F854|nr:transposase [Ruminococcus sp. 210702-SL.1.03]MCB6617293.1 transposase [Ruminococcus sp. 210702-SL.1.03]
MNKLTESELEFIISRVLDNAKDAAQSTEESQFNEGKKLAYYEILDTIKNELTVRDIDVKRFGLDTVLEELL